MALDLHLQALDRARARSRLTGLQEVEYLVHLAHAHQQVGRIEKARAVNEEALSRLSKNAMLRMLPAAMWANAKEDGWAVLLGAALFGVFWPLHLLTIAVLLTITITITIGVVTLSKRLGYCNGGSHCKHCHYQHSDH